MPTRRRNITFHILISPVYLWGCEAHTTNSAYSPSERQAILKTVLAQEIEIVPEFTRPIRLKQEGLPDALNVVLRARNRYGEPTRLAGDLVFELHTYRPASSDPRGQLIQTWTHALRSAEDQAACWKRQTQMYELPLAIDVSSLPVAVKFVVVVRHTNLWAEHAEDFEILDLSGFRASAPRSLHEGQRSKPRS